ncbi:hypothetical protein ACJX0J_041993, partial [Zea mays]
MIIQIQVATTWARGGPQLGQGVEATTWARGGAASPQSGVIERTEDIAGSSEWATTWAMGRAWGDRAHRGQGLGHLGPQLGQGVEGLGHLGPQLGQGGYSSEKAQAPATTWARGGAEKNLA